MDELGMVISLGERVSVVEESAKSAHHRIDKNDRITDGIHEIAVEMGKMQESIKNLTETLERTVKELSDRVTKIEEKPTKRWETILTQVVGLIVAAAFGVFAGKFGV